MRQRLIVDRAINDRIADNARPAICLDRDDDWGDYNAEAGTHVVTNVPDVRIAHSEHLVLPRLYRRPLGNGRNAKALGECR
jgi:hypothetical protein